MNQPDKNKEVVRNAIAAFNARDLDLFFSYHTEDTTSKEVYFEEPLGRDEFREFLEEFWYSYPDAHIDTKNMVAEGNTVVVENVLSATFENDFGDVEATGRSYTVNEAVFFELKGGKIKAARIYMDRKTIEEQLGTG